MLTVNSTLYARCTMLSSHLCGCFALLVYTYCMLTVCLLYAILISVCLLVELLYLLFALHCVCFSLVLSGYCGTTLETVAALHAVDIYMYATKTQTRRLYTLYYIQVLCYATRTLVTHCRLEPIYTFSTIGI